MAGEEFFGAPPTAKDQTEENGYDTQTIGGFTGQGQASGNWGGLSSYEINGQRVRGTSGAERDSERYRQMGARQSAPITLDQGQADQARGLQMGGLGLLQAQADGSAPSAAQILSQRANQAGAHAVGATGLGKGGIGAHIAAMGGAGPAAGQQMLAANAQNAQTRAAEIAKGQQAYYGGASGMRGQDIGAATTDAQLEAQRRAMDEQRQQAFERRSWDTTNAQMQAQAEIARQKYANEQAQRAARDADFAATFDKAKTIGGMGLGGLSGLAPKK